MKIEVKLCSAVRRRWLIVWPCEVTGGSNDAAWQRPAAFQRAAVVAASVGPEGGRGSSKRSTAPRHEDDRY